MGKSVAEIYEEAATLDEDDRARLAGLLLQSIEIVADRDVEGAWVEEIEERLASIDDGSAKLVPWEEVKRRTHEKLSRSFGG